MKAEPGKGPVSPVPGLHPLGLSLESSFPTSLWTDDPLVSVHGFVKSPLQDPASWLYAGLQTQALKHHMLIQTSMPGTPLTLPGQDLASFFWSNSTSAHLISIYSQEVLASDGGRCPSSRLLRKCHSLIQKNTQCLPYASVIGSYRKNVFKELTVSGQ